MSFFGKLPLTRKEDSKKHAKLDEKTGEKKEEPKPVEKVEKKEEPKVQKDNSKKPKEEPPKPSTPQPTPTNTEKPSLRKKFLSFFGKKEEWNINGEISGPINFQHIAHIDYDEETGLTGAPEEWTRP